MGHDRFWKYMRKKASWRCSKQCDTTYVQFGIFTEQKYIFR